MKLNDILNGLTILETTADLNADITDVCYDSRQAVEGGLFVAIAGAATDGHRYIPMVQEKGAACVVCQQVPDCDIPYVLVEDSRRALAVIACNWFDHPSREMTMVGVTGTSGKTTSTYLIKSILEQKAGAKVGLIGTIQNMIGSEVLHTERTTPESFELQKLLRRMSDAGCTHAVMEVSSHALVLDRVYGIRFAVGIFTNLSQDHLDFHRAMEEYCDAKAILFDRCDVGVYNADDPSLYDAITGVWPVNDAIVKTVFGVDVLKSNTKSMRLEEMLTEYKLRGRAYNDLLSKLLTPIENNYDYIIIDCPPQGYKLLENVQRYADYILIPMIPDEFALHSLRIKAESLIEIRRTINPHLRLLGGLIIMDEKNGTKAIYRDALQSQDVIPFFSATVRKNITLSRAINAHEPINTYAKHCNGNIDYQAVVNEIIGRVEK